jgi:hypothetical protein
MVGTAAAVIITCGIVAGAVTGLIPSAVSRNAEPCVSCGTVVAVRQVQVDDEARTRRTLSQLRESRKMGAVPIFLLSG